MSLRLILVLACVSTAAVAVPSTAPTTECKENERWSDCDWNECVVNTCDNIGKNMESVDNPERGRCICKKNHVRNSENLCIPIKECTSCGGDANATVTLDGSRNCNCSVLETYVSKERFLSRGCVNFNSIYGPILECQCKPGYAIDDTTGKCIHAEECPKSCGGDINARPDPGREGGCQSTCSNPVVERYTEGCILNDCICVLGYIYDKPHGKCIPVEECPNDQGCNDDFNAELIRNASYCPKYCHQSDSSDCEHWFRPAGCRCKPGFILSSPRGSCVEESRCARCGHENNATSVGGCSHWCSTLDTMTSYERLFNVCQSAIPSTTVDGCRCAQGYFLNDATRKCIHFYDCPKSCDGDTNARFSMVASSCQPTCANPNPADCTKNFTSGCACILDHVFDKPGGKCVPIEKCPKDQGCNDDPNAVIALRVNSCPATCTEPENRFCELWEVTIGCKCKPGFIRSSQNGQCIEESQCSKWSTPEPQQDPLHTKNEHL